MSTPQPSQAGGYGPTGPTGPAGPYGQQPYPQQQPPPPGPYGSPQPGPYAGGSHPGPGGWGAPPPPPPPPPPRNNAWRTIGIVALVVAGAGALLLFSAWGNRNSDTAGGPSDSAFPAAEYRLTLQKTLLDGEYTLAGDHSSQGPQDDGSWDESNIKDMTPVVGQYTGKGDAASGKALVVSGMYGRISDPDEARRSMLRGAGTAQGTSIAVAAKDITPDGGGETVRCQVLTQQQSGVKVQMPMCAWADGNTAAGVATVDPAAAGQDLRSIDLEEAARTALAVRDEMREPLD
ncbi:hypothetical protein [Streptomyces sp. NPDC002851]